jgi:hypothetical protein
MGVVSDCAFGGCAATFLPHIWLWALDVWALDERESVVVLGPAGGSKGLSAQRLFFEASRCGWTFVWRSSFQSGHRHCTGSANRFMFLGERSWHVS